MRRTLLTGLLALVLGLSLSQGAIAGHHKGKGQGVCPVKTLEHSKELGLTAKQKNEIKKIKADTMAALEKASNDTQKVLTPEQVAKYHSLAADKGQCSAKEKGKKECCKKEKGKKECCKKEEGKKAKH